MSSSSSPPSTFTSFAPGRLCLFGEHQDYLHLPVIALALPLYCQIRVTPTPSSNRIILHVPQLQQTFIYDLHNLPETARNSDGTPDFALAALLDAIHDGWKFSNGGATCISTTDIPMQAGCSSSSAFCVAFVQALHRLNHETPSTYIPLTPLQLAKRAHHAEVLHFGAPGGNMDHITSAFGGTVRIGSGDDFWHVEHLPPLNMDTVDDDEKFLWIMVDSGEPKDTMAHLQRCKYDRIRLLEDRLGGDWDTSTVDLNLTDKELQLLEATLTTRNTEAMAADAWMQLDSASPDRTPQKSIQEHLAQLMNRHHEALRDGLLLSTTKLEQLRDAALLSGALGFKLVGSGGGGCGVAWTPFMVANAVDDALKRAGAKSTWSITHASRGAYIDDLIN